MDKTISLEKKPSETSSGQYSAKPGTEPDNSSGQMRSFLRAVAVLALCFTLPLYRLGRFAMGNELYSYIPLMPFVSWYLIHLRKRDSLPQSEPMRALGAVFLAGAAALLGWYYFGGYFVGKVDIQNYLSAMILAFVLALLGVAGIFMGRKMLSAFAFPLGMLIFIVPMPLGVQDAVQGFLQEGSATMTDLMYFLSGMTYMRDDLIFHLPGFSLQVAPECSGIHSTWILLITSLLAGYLFLRSPWRRGILALAVLPLALLRNGFRVFTIGELCVHISPTMIDSPIHHHGGPLFFVLSLIPFFMLLAWLHKSERPAAKPTHPNSN